MGAADVTMRELALVELYEGEADSLKARIAELESDLRETLRAVLYNFGPDGAKVVTEHVVAARAVLTGDQS